MVRSDESDAISGFQYGGFVPVGIKEQGIGSAEHVPSAV
jgi:hypothetical protein